MGGRSGKVRPKDPVMELLERLQAIIDACRNLQEEIMLNGIEK